MSFQEKGYPAAASLVLLAKAEASVAPRKGKNCACVHWFGEKSGEWPQVWGEECVPSKSLSFLPDKAIAGGQGRKTPIRAVAVIEKISWTIISLIDI